LFITFTGAREEASEVGDVPGEDDGRTREKEGEGEKERRREGEKERVEE